MKLGVSINLFDGLELLEPCINQFKIIADHISIIYQKVSNHNQPAPPQDLKYLQDLRRNRKINNPYIYEPKNNLAASVNEINKRNIGLTIAKYNDCTHFMSIDVDEFYKPEDLIYAKNIIEHSNYDSSVCQLQTFYGTPEYCFAEPETYYVPLIYKIRPGLNFEFGEFPVLVDPTRKQTPGNLTIFERSEIEMYHLSYVRQNIRSKLENSSARINFNDKIDSIVKYYDNWKPGQPGLIAGNPLKLVNLKKVKPIITIREN